MSINPENSVTVTKRDYSIMPHDIEAQINDAIKMRDALTKLFENLLEMGKDYDRIPGTDKPTLLRSGAEMLCKVFHLSQGKSDMLDKNEDWDKGVFSYTIGMPLIHMDTGVQVAYGIGAANSLEKRHRYRRDAAGKQYDNPDKADLQNTLIKMANKRAFIDAVLKATGASRMFAQNMDDLSASAGQYEKASAKQKDFIKHMYNGVAGGGAMADVSGICGREVKSFEDLTRAEASKIISVKKSKSPPPEA
ncbi:MAG: hypothetical protein LBB94_03880 [Clostridiales bacterium]|jgi:hypothetical protein|nr:hypothetical protein [Clostridiales bacterium]